MSTNKTKYVQEQCQLVIESIKKENIGLEKAKIIVKSCSVIVRSMIADAKYKEFKIK